MVVYCFVHRCGDNGVAMDVTGLAAFLAPFLPSLVKGAERLATDVADRLGEAGFGVAKRMWELLRPRVEQDPRAEATVEEVAEDPDDPVLQAMLAKRLEQLLAEDAALAADVGRLFDEARAANLVSASGERSVAVGRDLSGTVITGDDAVVTGDDIRAVVPTDSRGRPAVGGDPPPTPPS
jgi:plasmid maintenance system antidote protein VapI